MNSDSAAIHDANKIKINGWLSVTTLLPIIVGAIMYVFGSLLFGMYSFAFTELLLLAGSFIGFFASIIWSVKYSQNLMRLCYGVLCAFCNAGIFYYLGERVHLFK